MRRVLFDIAGVKIHSYGVMLVIAFLVGILLGQRRAAKFGLSKENVLDAAFWALILGILGARALYIIQEWGYYSQHTREIYKLQFDGLTSFGGLIGGFLGLILWAKRSKKPLLSILDMATACFLLAHPIGRIGCLLNGCCYGHQCDLPWGVPVEGLLGKYHPAQVYDGLMNLAALGILLFVEKRGLKAGQSLGLFLVLHGLTRVIYEIWRAGTSSTTISGLPITEAQVAAGVIMLAGLVLFIVKGRKPNPEVVAT